jgi:tape measure domain-containing protein
MSNVENRVVSITFDNGKFSENIESTLESLAKLEAGLDFKGGKDAFAQMQHDIDSLNLSNISDDLDTISSKFSALGAIAFAGLQRVTNAAIDVATNMYDQTLGQIISGGTARYLAIEQARFQFEGLGQDVEASMESAKAAVLGTAYGLDEAATIAASFGAAGLHAGQQLEDALRGVAGVASVAGKPFAQIGTIFQDIAANGALTGGALWRFQQQGIGMSQILANHWGMTVEELEALAAAGQITFQEFADATNELFGDQATKANETYAGSLANVRSALNRLGAEAIGPKLEATRNVFNALSPVIDKVKDALAPLFKVWKDFVNFQAIKAINFLDGLNVHVLARVIPQVVKILRNLFDAVASFIAPIKEAFREIFPPMTTRSIMQIAKAIKRFTADLSLSSETADKVRRIFAGFFAVLSIGFAIVKGVIGIIWGIVQALLPAGQGVLSFGASIGDILVALEEFLVGGGNLNKFFEEVTDKITDFMDAVRDSAAMQAFGDALIWIGEAISDVFGDAVDAVNEALFGMEKGFGKTEDSGNNFFDAIKDGFDVIVNAVKGVKDWFVDTFSGLGETISNAISSGDIKPILAILGAGLIGGLAKIIYDVMHGGIFDFITGGMMSNAVDSVVGMIDGVTGALEEFQNVLKANIMMTLAKAIALLTVSIVALSFIDAGALARSLGAITVGFTELAGTMQLLSRMEFGPDGARKIIALGIAIGAIATALLILTFAVMLMSTMDLFDMAKGLIGVAGGMAILAGGAKALGGISVDIYRSATSMILMALALLLMGRAVRKFGDMDFLKMGQGLVGVATAMAILVVAVKQIGAVDTTEASIKMLLLSISMNALAKAVDSMAGIDFWGMVSGLIGLAAGMAILVQVSKTAEGTVQGAAAMILIALSTLALSYALAKFAELEWEEIARGLVGMAGALLVAGGLGAVAGYLSPLIALGALAIGLMAGALLLLAPAVAAFAAMSWGDLLGGMLKLSAALLILGVASILLLPAIPTLLLLGLALIVLAAAVALFGYAAVQFANAFKIISDEGIHGAETVRDALMIIAEAIPAIMVEFARGFVEGTTTIVGLLPELVEAFVSIGVAILDALIELAPKAAEALIALVRAGLEALVTIYPEMVDAGLNLVIALLEGLAENIPEICAAARNVVTSLIGCLVENITSGGLIGTGGKAILQFTRGIREKIGGVLIAGARIIGSLISAIAEKIGSIASKGRSAVASFISGIVGRVGSVVTTAYRVVRDFVGGLLARVVGIVNAGRSMVTRFIEGVVGGAVRLASAAANMVGDFISDIVSAIGNGVGAITDAIAGLIGDAWDAAMDRLPFGGSPAKHLGRRIVSDLVEGLDEERIVTESIEKLTNGLIRNLSLTAQKVSDVLGDMDEFNPTITPVLDLTDIHSKAKQLGKIFGDRPVLGNVSYVQARGISNSTESKEDSVNSRASSGPTQVIFEQTINAPTELSVADIYRQTKSQIEMAKTELEIR